MVAILFLYCGTSSEIRVKNNFKTYTQLVKLDLSHDEKSSPRTVFATYIIEKKKNEFVTGSLILNVNLEEADAPLDNNVKLNINGYEFILKLKSLGAKNPHREMVDITSEYEPVYVPLNSKVYELMQKLKSFTITLTSGDIDLVYMVEAEQLARLRALTSHDPRKKIKKTFVPVHDI